MLIEIGHIGQQPALPLPPELMAKPAWQHARYANVVFKAGGEMAVNPVEEGYSDQPIYIHEINDEDLKADYQAMAADEAREAEAQEWCEAMIGDLKL